MIGEFSGKYRFLSNFFMTPIKWDGATYPSVEHAYQAAKFPPQDRHVFWHQSLRPGEAKRKGRGKGGPDWHSKSLWIMLDLVRIKFEDPKLRESLLATGTEHLEEGNWWGDTFFGVVAGIGQNHLGRILMQVREEIRNGY
jgi:ribA/ribD-fused uncharacterized protein